MSNSIYAGIDLGSISLNLVIIDSNARLQEGIYVRTKGQPLHTLLRVLHDLSSKYEFLDNIFITGSGRNILSELFSCNAVNETGGMQACIAQAHGCIQSVDREGRVHIVNLVPGLPYFLHGRKQYFLVVETAYYEFLN